MKLVLDDIFGKDNFRNEIVWQRFNYHADGKRCGIVHDNLLFYSKDETVIWNKEFALLKDEYLASHFTQKNSDGRPDRLDDAPARGYWSVDPGCDGELFRSGSEDYRGNTENDYDPLHIVKKPELGKRLVKPGKRRGCMRVADVFGFEAEAVKEA